MATITPFVDRENLHSSRKLSVGIKSSYAKQQMQSAKAVVGAPRKALGDVGNKTDFIKRRADPNKNSKRAGLSPEKPPVLRLKKHLEADAEHKRSSDEECPSIDEMPTYNDDLPDDYEDIWPKAERLSLEDLEQLIKWQPCSNSLPEITSEDEEITEKNEDVDPMKFFVAIECIPAAKSEELHSLLYDEPLFEFTPLDDDFY